MKHRERIEGIQAGLHYSFRNRDLLVEALTHKSFHHEAKDRDLRHNERLEFLGDSVIGLIVVESLFLNNEAYSESVLAKVKSYIVSETVLAEIAGTIGLDRFIMLGKGEEFTGGRTKKSILSDALEAVIGAVYLDGGFDRARELVLKFLGDKIDAAILSGEFHDYKTELQERTQMLYGLLPEYRVVREQGEEHKRIFTISVFVGGRDLGTASGGKKKEAEALAAKKALEALSDIPASNRTEAEKSPKAI